MIQARNQNDPRWFNPDRDMIWSLPRTISKSFNSLADVSEEDSQHLCVVALELARIINSVRVAKMKSEEVKECLLKLEAAESKAFAQLHRAFFMAYFAQLWGWCSEIASGPDSPRLEIKELEKLIDEFTKRGSKPA